MKTLSPSAAAAALTQSFCRHRTAAFLLVLPLVLAMSGVVTGLAQSPPAVRSTASPSPTAGEKRGPNDTLPPSGSIKGRVVADDGQPVVNATLMAQAVTGPVAVRSEEHTSELQSPCNLVCRLLLEKKNNTIIISLLVDHTTLIMLNIT